MLRRIWTISSFLSISRILLLAPLAYFLFTDVPHRHLWAAVVMLAAGATDFLDGYLARRLHQVTDFGKIIDPLADKITVGVGTAMLVMVGLVPLWYVIVVVSRDILILIGGIYIQSKKKIITQSNWPGKIAVSLVAFVMLESVLHTATLDTFRDILVWSSILMMALSLYLYVQRLFIGTLHAGRNSV
jgi:cardiolipin synthase (CMP-forming)